jgi:TonB-dependent SusC/RagA subfamily outer membrane receptor
MKTTIVTIAGLFLLVAASAQNPVRTRTETARVINTEFQPLFIVDDSIVNDKILQTLNPNRIASIDILKDSAATAVYGEKAKNGVVIIHTKTGIVYLDLNQTLDQYHISGENRKLKVCVDNILVKNRNKIMTDPSDIQRIEVIKDICWKSPAEAGPEETYINIVTKKPVKATP